MARCLSTTYLQTRLRGEDEREGAVVQVFCRQEVAVVHVLVFLQGKVGSSSLAWWFGVEYRARELAKKANEKRNFGEISGRGQQRGQVPGLETDGDRGSPESLPGYLFQGLVPGAVAPLARTREGGLTVLRRGQNDDCGLPSGAAALPADIKRLLIHAVVVGSHAGVTMLG